MKMFYKYNMYSYYKINWYLYLPVPFHLMKFKIMQIGYILLTTIIREDIWEFINDLPKISTYVIA